MQPLFQPLTVGNITFPNRIVMPPMVSGKGNGGAVTDETIKHYTVRAESGIAYVIVEATAVDDGGICWPGGLSIYDDCFLPGLTRLAEAVKARGAVAGIQLVHGGPQASAELSGGNTVGPSSVLPNENASMPRELTAEEIVAIEERFAEAAERALMAGFDIVQVHGAHGYLLDSFLSLVRNRRTDEYGGSLENRMRMLLETCRKVRGRIGSRALLECRISLYNKEPDEFSSDDFRCLVAALESTGIEMLNISTDGAFKPFFGTDKPLGKWAKDFTRLPVVVAGGLGNPLDANRIIAEGAADFAAIGSALYEDANWAVKARERLS